MEFEEMINTIYEYAVEHKQEILEKASCRNFKPISVAVQLCSHFHGKGLPVKSMGEWDRIAQIVAYNW